MTDRIDPASVGAIGYKDEMAVEDLAGKHIDGLTGLVFDTEEAYCNHTSPVTGVTPADIEHQGPEFAAISEEALKRGEERKGEEVSPAEKAQMEAETTESQEEIKAEEEEVKDEE